MRTSVNRFWMLLLVIAATVPSVAPVTLFALDQPADSALVDTSKTMSQSAADRNSSSDAAARMKATFETAKKLDKDVMIIFGADWCDRCALLQAYLEDDLLANHVAEQFVVLKIDVGYWDENRRYEAQMGHPTREGLPAVVIVEADDDFAEVMGSEDLLTFLPDRDQPIYAWMENILQFAKDSYVLR